jgi:hypothetical protein
MFNSVCHPNYPGTAATGSDRQLPPELVLTHGSTMTASTSTILHGNPHQVHLQQQRSQNYVDEMAVPNTLYCENTTNDLDQESHNCTQPEVESLPRQSHDPRGIVSETAESPPPHSASPAILRNQKLHTRSSPPSTIVIENGLQYANLDNSNDEVSSARGLRNSYLSYQHHYQQPFGSYDHSSQPQAAISEGNASTMLESNQSIIPGDSSSLATGPGIPSHSFTTYLENAAVAGMNMAVAYGHNHYTHPASGIYGSHASTVPGVSSSGTHHPMACNKIRSGSHQADFFGHLPKPTTNVPTYKWMQVKRNVPKPGNICWYVFFICFK